MLFSFVDSMYSCNSYFEYKTF